MREWQKRQGLELKRTKGAKSMTIKSNWFAPDPDRYSVLRESYAHRSQEREWTALLGWLFAGCLLAWLFVLGVDAGINVGWIKP